MIREKDNRCSRCQDDEKVYKSKGENIKDD